MRNPVFKIAGFLACLAAASACGGDDKKNDTGNSGGDGDSDVDVVDNGTDPVISAFTAGPSAITPGASAILSWSATNADSLTLDGAAITGTTTTVTIDATHAYELKATNGHGSVTSTATVTVSANPNTVPQNPIAYEANTRFTVNGDFIFVPDTYDSSHETPITLFVWLHGCGGQSLYDIANVSPKYYANDAAQNWIAVAPIGAENDCWSLPDDVNRVLTTIATVKTHFNINPRRVILGGYSSGGDLGYRTIFYNALQFAGIVATNTSPFRDTKSSSADSLAAAKWKFNVYHLAHAQDTTYPYQDFTLDDDVYTGVVKNELDAMQTAEFPLSRDVVEGDHYDDGVKVDALGNVVPGTDADIRTYLLPKINLGWTAP